MTLRALRIAAAVLGITGAVILDFLTYVLQKAGDAEKTAKSASTVADQAKTVAGRASTDLTAEKEAALDTVRKQDPLIAHDAFAALEVAHPWGEYKDRPVMSKAHEPRSQLGRLCGPGKFLMSIDLDAVGKGHATVGSAFCCKANTNAGSIGR